MNAHAILTSHGWRGTGHTLHAHNDMIGIRKPILVKHKKDNKGLGSSDFTTDQWWLSAIDEQLKGLDTSGTKPVQTVKTGIIGRLDRRVQRYSLYDSFVKGETLGSTIDKPQPSTSSSSPASNSASGSDSDSSSSSSSSPRTSSARKSTTLTPPSTHGSATPSDASTAKKPKASRRAEKDAKKARKAEKTAKKEAKVKRREEKAAKHAAKEEKRAKKLARAKEKDARRAKKLAKRATEKKSKNKAD